MLRADGGAVKGMARLVRGAPAVVAQSGGILEVGLSGQVALVNGNIGVLSRLPDGRLLSVIGFTIAGGKVVGESSRLDRNGVAAPTVPWKREALHQVPERGARIARCEERAYWGICER